MRHYKASGHWLMGRKTEKCHLKLLYYFELLAYIIKQLNKNTWWTDDFLRFSLATVLLNKNIISIIHYKNEQIFQKANKNYDGSENWMDPMNSAASESLSSSFE